MVFFGLFCWVLSYVQCASGPDVDYVVETGEETDPNAALAACEAQRYLTEDCVNLVSEENDRLLEEQSTVLLASQDVNDILDCYDFVSVSDDDTETAEAETVTLDCEAVATNLLAGFSVCVSQTEEIYYECSDIEESVNAAIALCDVSSEEISTDFCSLINPTTDTTE